MSEMTKIQWTDASLSPWWGCTKVSPGCLNCYAEGLDARFHGGDHWGKGKPRKRIDSFEKNALALDRKAKRLGKRLKVFPSMCDPFDPEVPIEWLADFLDVMRRTPNLIWLVLTKRPGLFNYRISAVIDMLDGGELADWLCNWLGFPGICQFIPRNVWIGTSVEDQQRADLRITQLLRIPAWVRFLSCEPLLGPLDILPLDGKWFPMQHIHWVICGCESGANRRPMNSEWARKLRNQCGAAGNVPFFMKQMEVDGKVTGDIERFPTCLQVREFPEEVTG